MFYFFEVEDQNFLERIYRFRYEILCEELKFFDANRYKKKLEHDEYDDYSHHFVAIDEDFNIVATVRLIHHSPIGYPTLHHLKLYPGVEELLTKLKYDRLCEISRVFIDKKYRNFSDTKTIIKHFMTEQIYLKAKDHGLEYGFAAIEKRFWLLLKKFNINFELIGKQQEGYGSPRYPAILPIYRFEKDNKEMVKNYLRRRWY